MRTERLFAMRTQDRDRVGGLAKGLAIIEAFEAASPRLTVTEAARKTGLTRAAARRYLLTLESLGFAESDGKLYWLTPRVLRLGYAYLSTASVPKIAQPILDGIGERTEDVASLATLDGAEVVFLARSSIRRIVAATTNVGTRRPAYCTAMGRVMLASRPDAEVRRLLRRAPLRRLTPHTKTEIDQLMAEIAGARASGFCVIDQELELGLRTIAVPVADSRGTVELALAVSLQAVRMTVEDMVQRILPELQAGRRALERML